MPRREPTKDEKRCSHMAYAIKRIGSVAAELANDAGVPGAEGRPTIRSMVLGPEEGEVHYNLSCLRPQERGSFGPGTCGVYVLERSGPGLARGLAPRAHVGNLFGLLTQLSRDATRLYGCAPAETAGFEGTRRRRAPTRGSATRGRGDKKHLFQKFCSDGRRIGRPKRMTIEEFAEANRRQYEKMGPDRKSCVWKPLF